MEEEDRKDCGRDSLPEGGTGARVAGPGAVMSKDGP